MNSTSYLKSICESCGGRIEFPEEGVGQSVLCPHCQMTTVLRQSSAGASRVRKRAVWIIISALLVAGLAVGFAYEWVRRSKLREKAEKTFPLSEAYKQTPPTYQEAGDQHLLGKTIRHDYATMTPQSLDALFAVRADADRQFEALRAAWRKKGENARAGVDYLFSGESDYFRARLQMEALSNQLKTLPELERQSSNLSLTVKNTLGQWLQDGRLVKLEADTRVRVLDISSHYAKVKPLEGPQADKTVFVRTDNLLVK